MNRFVRAFKASQVFAPNQLFHLAAYQIQKRAGWFRLSGRLIKNGSAIRFQPLPAAENSAALIQLLAAQRDSVLADADNCLQSRFFPYSGADSIPIDFSPAHPDQHWSAIRSDSISDIKDLWEPARFCWLSTLVRAALLQNDATVYTHFFIEKLRRFRTQNPFGFGENWASAQEVAIRLIWTTLAASVFTRLGGAEGTALNDEIAGWIEDHAFRIMQTRGYAIAQNNNHWLSESAGLMTAACALPEHPQAEKWFERGWRDFQDALSIQILPDGAYIQQSANYHRLMFQLILWVNLLLQTRRLSWPETLVTKIRRSLRWLLRHIDPFCGQVWTFGNNDGAHLFPLGEKFEDYRPTLRAVTAIFSEMERKPFSAEDELSLWFNINPVFYAGDPVLGKQTPLDHTVLRLERENGWAMLRAAAFLHRPAHADQLHVSIWQDGVCFALDPGTFRYSASEPWDNALKSAFVHNAPVVDRREPMTDAGRFLWLDWDQARILDIQEHAVSAEHLGYRRLDARAVRSLRGIAGGWAVEDALHPLSASTDREYEIRLNWLVPDSDYMMEPLPDGFILQTQRFALRLTSADCRLEVQIVRAGERIFANPMAADSDSCQTICGWNASCYASLSPALSVILNACTSLPCRIVSEWIFDRKRE